MRFLVVSLCASLLFCSEVNAQNIRGTIADSLTFRPVFNAKIIATSANDTARYFVAYSDSTGSFVLKPGIGPFRITILQPGFKTKTLSTMVKSDVSFGRILIVDLAVSTGTAKISTSGPPVKQNGDTTEYNANAYKVNPDATAEDLVKKMPGITVENGTVKANGEEVKKVTVDGKEFFGDDAQTALKNLPADVVEKIQVFERMSDQAQFTGFDDGQGVRAINIKTKTGKTNGTFGKAYAGYGTDYRYQTGLTYNNFKQDRRITLLGLSNNINIQNFTSQDLVGINSFGGNRGGFGGPGGPRSSPSDNFLVSQAAGISTSHAAGLNYNDKWGKKITIGASYFFNASNNTQAQTILRTYNNNGNTESRQWYSEASNSANQSMNHRFNMRLEYAPDTNNSFIYTPNFSLQNSSILQQISAYNYNNSDTFNNSVSSYENSGLGYNLNHSLLYRHKFAKAGRTFSLSADNQWNSKSSGGYNRSSNQSFIPNDSIFLTDQQIESVTPTLGYGSRISYTEPISKTSMLQLDYRYSRNENANEKNTWNAVNGSNEYSYFDTLLSNNYNTVYTSHQPGIMYRIRGPKLSIGAGAGYQYAELNGEQIFPFTDVIHRKFSNVLPRVFMNYKWNKTTNIRGMFRSSTNIPSITQLQNVVNTSNPLILSTGNAALKQEVSQNLNLNFSKTNTSKMTNIYLGLFGTQTSNYITNATRFLTADSQISDGFVAVRGAQITAPVNLNGYWNSRLFGVYGFPVKKIKSNMNVNGAYSVGQKPGLINAVKNVSNTQSITGGIALSSNISQNLDFNIGYTTNYYTAKNSTQVSLNNNYVNQVVSGRLNYILKNRFVLNTDVNYNSYTGLSTGFNQNFALWNAGIGYKFMKGNAAEVRLSCFDILAQNRSINRTITESYIEDNITKVLTRYLMLTFTFNFRKFESGSSEPKPAEEDPGRMGPPGGIPPGGRPPF